MKKKKSKSKWFFAAKCQCGMVSIVGVAPSPDEAPDWRAPPQTVLCNKCDRRTSYVAEEFWRTPHGPK